MAVCLPGLLQLMSPYGSLSSSPETLQYFGTASGRMAFACGLPQIKTSGSQFLPCKTRMTNTSQPHKGVTRLNMQVCKTHSSYSPGSHRKAHKSKPADARAKLGLAPCCHHV